ncbi:MAG: DegT/DnrJ/EryC1/StrS family aminotransferase [Armatimonadota bacterium]
MKPLPAVPMPLTLGDLRRACRDSGARVRLEEQIAAYHGAHAAFGVSSGRTALWLILRALRALRPERHRVIIPAYTCPTVGRSLLEAGLRGLCADVSLDTFNIDPAAVQAAIDERVLAVIAPHMFGVPCDLASLAEICREYDAYLVEDCAQCVGGSWSGAKVGTWGDAAFLSLGRGKNLRGFEGGLVWTTREELAGPLREQFERLPAARSGASDRLKQAAVTVLSRPHLWAIAKRVPGLGVGAEDESFDPRPAKLADWQAGLGLISLRRLETCNDERRRLAVILRDGLSGAAGLGCQAVPPGAQPTYPRFATRLTGDEASRRDELMARLQAANIDARAFYTRIMSEYDWMQRDCGEAGGLEAGRSIVTTNLVLPIPPGADEATLYAAGATLAEALCCPR